MFSFFKDLTFSKLDSFVIRLVGLLLLIGTAIKLLIVELRSIF